MLSRNLLYTALTRARRCAIVVGDQAALARAVAETRDLQRTTGLAPLLTSPLVLGHRNPDGLLHLGDVHQDSGDGLLATTASSATESQAPRALSPGDAGQWPGAAGQERQAPPPSRRGRG
jgi:hypothetical protein